MIGNFFIDGFLGSSAFGSVVAVLHVGQIHLLIFTFFFFLANFRARGVEFLLVKIEWIYTVVVVILFSTLVVPSPSPSFNIA